jgi:cyclohexanone monooxygenase
MIAARLHQAGVTDLRILEKAGDFGGTWYWNRYPGAQCDIESYVYLPLLEATGYVPKLKYAFAPEIFEHAQRIGRHFNLYERACFRREGRVQGCLSVHTPAWNDRTKMLQFMYSP